MRFLICGLIWATLYYMSEACDPSLLNQPYEVNPDEEYIRALESKSETGRENLSW